jgi:hypothetical protein
LVQQYLQETVKRLRETAKVIQWLSIFWPRF